MANNASAPTDIRQAFLEYEREVRIQNYKVACILALIFMPAGVTLDYLVNRDLVPEFFRLRLLCSALLLFIWWLVQTRFGRRYYQMLGLVVAGLPSFFISLMIYKSQGADSTYYAGLNLVLLGAAIVLRWTLRDSVMVFLMALGFYLAACFLQGPIRHPGIFYNNLYFLSVTGIFVVIGSYFYNRIRFAEFELRFELDRSRKMLEENNQKLLELDQVKSRFFANISHELRTPLTLLLAPLETLLHRSQTLPPEEARAMLVTMQANGMRLLKLINDLLDLVRLESGRMEIKPEALEVEQFIKGLVSAARQVANDKKVRLTSEVHRGLGTILADRDKLEKILLNLIFNALKFTPSGGTVHLEAQKDDAHLVLVVSDTGVGISQKNLPFIFDRFWQADSSARRKYQGVGIGLSLVKELAEVQGGTVSVESAEGRGTTFQVRIPFAAAEGSAPPAPATEGAPKARPGQGAADVSSEEWLSNLYRRAELFHSVSRAPSSQAPSDSTRNGDRPSLLIADDEPDMLAFLKSQLGGHYRLIEAVNGREAVERARALVPDIILLDMMMPEKDGLQACRELREVPPTQNTPIILLTARADEETKLSALSAGASDFLAKPFSVSELHVRIKNLVDSHHFQKKLAQQNQILESTIEQLKETEIQLVQTEKLASLGRMSAGIIHEINNPLNFAATGLYTLRKKGRCFPPDQQNDFAETLKDVEEGISRVKNIVSDLRTFTHPDAEGLDEVELAEAVTPALRFLSNEWKDKVEIRQHIPPGQVVWGNKNRLTQVFVNLLQNSLDAFKIKQFDGERPVISIESRTEGNKTIVTVRDNGEGIRPEHLNKIFDPFFTTKEVGEGMGLGLSICYRIMQNCQGQIRVQSEPGKSCEVTLEFPGSRPSDPAEAAS